MATIRQDEEADAAAVVCSAGGAANSPIVSVEAAKFKTRVSVANRLSGRISVLLVALLATSAALGCKPKYFGQRSENKIACQCDKHYCDSLDFTWPEDGEKFVRVTSAKSGARFQVDELLAAEPEANSRLFDYAIDVQTNNRRQQVIGYGGAATDAATQLLMDLPEAVRSKAFDSYFGPQGLNYNMMRVPCGGTDMSRRLYSYDDLAYGREDLALDSFALQREDLDYKIPFISRAIAMRGAEMKLMTTSWSPPAWMKDNNKLTQGYLRRDHNGRYYEAYARYLLRFLDEYEKRNITFWALAGQNEPYTTRRVGISFNSMNFLPEQLADFHEHHLIPALKAAGRTPDKLRLFLFDDNLSGHEPFTEALLARPSIVEFARGLARHWYINDGSTYVDLSMARLQYPYDYFAATTEASFIGYPQPGSWQRAELYALDIMENLLAGFNAWIDWNLALDMSGGPTWVGNYLDAAILVDPSKEVFYKNPMYYALGHVARFVQPSARLVNAQVFALNATTGNEDRGHWSKNFGRDGRPLTVVAGELAPDASSATSGSAWRRFAVVLLNRAPKSARVQLRLAECRAKQQRPTLELELQPNSITSLAFNC